MRVYDCVIPDSEGERGCIPGKPGPACEGGGSACLYMRALDVPDDVDAPEPDLGAFCRTLIRQRNGAWHVAGLSCSLNLLQLVIIVALVARAFGVAMGW